MSPWEVWTFDFPDAGAHPAVVISHPDRVRNAAFVNILICSTHRANRPPKPIEVLLDETDGFDWPTLCRCDAIYFVPKDKLYQRRGSVSVERRRAIIRTIIASLGFNLV